ncbi:DinB family protein [Autumnicola musiva]|uniref:DinB family protein n=1 Tax=Autumnicola musiva TaxID=3075589 RepID=A0ABU3D510_9FLAO|nr:DinB family protein [Zunongwangia sp. F117]MDT0676620.1 DinB family protein [Zunongwangia sp. F117]
MDEELLLRQQLTGLLKGGFAPNVILLREFSYDKCGVILDGLHFSAWILLGHIRARQQSLLKFMQDPQNNQDVWPDAHWPDNYQPETREEWDNAIDEYNRELEKVIEIVNNPETPIFKVQANGETISWAAMTILHHTGYHIGQLKTIGRQLGVW